MSSFESNKPFGKYNRGGLPVRIEKPNRKMRRLIAKQQQQQQQQQRKVSK